MWTWDWATWTYLGINAVAVPALVFMVNKLRKSCREEDAELHKFYQWQDSRNTNYAEGGGI